MRSLRLGYAVTALVAAAACGDGGNSTITLGDLPAHVAGSFCKNAFKCCDATELMDQLDGLDPTPTTEAQCTTALTALYQGLFDQNQNQAIAAGRLIYDGDAAAACLAALDSAACGAASQAAQRGCEQGVFVGAVAVGGMCKGDDECAGASVECDGGSETTLGTCVALPALGASCTGSCADGAYCNDSSMCAATKANGAACEFSGECTSDFCNDANLCADEPASTRCDGV